MECNKDDAVRSKKIAERKFKENDIAGAKKFALKAKALFKPLEGIDQMISALAVHIRGQRKIGEENDWYGILEVSPLADEETIKKQYKKLVLQTHPDKNSSICADGAFNLILDAWTVLSDSSNRMSYDQRRSMCGPQVHRSNYNANVDGTYTSSMSSVNGFWCQNSGPDICRKVPPHLVHIVPDTFWTYCGSCFVNFQYSREYVNRHLKCPACQAVFVAVEVPPPSSPVYPDGQNLVAANNNIGGATVSDMATPGIQAGVPPDNQNYDPTVPQQWSFLKSTTCAHSTRYTVQQTHESVRKKEAGEADTATNEESNIHRKVMQAVRKHARANVATKQQEAAKRRRAKDGKQASWQTVSSCCDGDLHRPGVPAKTKPRSTTSGAKKRKVSSGDRVGESSNNAARTSFDRVLMQLDTRAILIKNTKLQLREKLKTFNTKDNVKNEENMHISKNTTNIAFGAAIDVNKMRPKQNSNPVLPKEDDTTELISKRGDSEEKQTEKSSKQVSLEQKGKLCKWRSPEVYIVYTRRNRKKHKKEQADDDRTSANSATGQHLANKHGCLNQETSSDGGTSEMPVPDADFYNFGDHPESSFQNDQVWAVYDEEDGMPRYYASIRKALSTHPFKVKLAYLKAIDCNEFGASKWISCGYSKTCGEFKAGLSKDARQLNTHTGSTMRKV